MSFSFFECLAMSFRAIKCNGFRSFLTILSIAIGIASVTSIIAVMEGFSGQLTEQFKGLGTNALTITPYTPFKKALQGDRSRITHSDMEYIKLRIEGIRDVTPLLNIGRSFRGQVRHRAILVQTQVFGTTMNYQSLYDSFPVNGRFLTPSDDRGRRKVVVLGAKVAKELEFSDTPIGEYIQVGNVWLKVVGVMEERGELLGFSQDDYILLPYGTARNIVGETSDANIDSIVFKVAELSQIDDIKTKATKLLRTKHKIGFDEDADFKVSTAEQLMESVTSITDMLTAVLAGIVGVSLLVGGIGIMNIMLVSVVERTKEIGICKSLGATYLDILMQFLMEGLLLSLFGGFIGILIGTSLASLVTLLVPIFTDVVIPMWAIFLSVTFSAGLGILFGILPASKAANLNPVDALRHE